MVHSPCCGSVKAAVYSPRPAAGTTLALDTSPVAVVARIVGCSPESKVTPCCRTAKVRFTGFPATAYSGKSFRVTIAHPPAKAALMRMNTRAGVVTILITWFVVIANPFSLLPELRHHFLAGIEHLRIERYNTVPRDFRRRRQQFGQTAVNHSARLRIHARKQMPQGQSVAHVRLTDHDLKLAETLVPVV